MAGEIIKPQRLKGFRDTMPEEAIRRNRLTGIAQSVIESFGFRPFATPALELTEILLGKGSEENDKQLYRFQDNGGRDVAMRFDLTVGLARFVAEHAAHLTLPFRGYNTGTVWRGERPQKGRFREFVQFDADIVGTDSWAADAEIVSMFAAVLDRLDIGEFTMRINDRRIAIGLCASRGIANVSGALRAVDKIDKIGPAGVETELKEAGVEGDDAAALLSLVELRAAEEDDLLAHLERLVGGNVTGRAGLDSIRAVRGAVAAAGVPDTRVRIDPSIVRGLDYYTGTVFETTLAAAPEIGSISSGGRYDDLASLYSKQRFPGVGGSLGIDRILAALDGTQPGAARQDLVVVTGRADTLGRRFQAARRIREAGLAAEVYADDRPLDKQTKYADVRGARFVLQVEPDATVLRDLTDGSRHPVATDDDLAALLASLT